MKLALILISLLLNCSLLAVNIGLNFTNADADKSLLATDSAGVAPHQNWNNMTNATGAQTTANLKNDSGVATTASVSTSFGFTNQNGGGTGSANDKLYRAYGLIKDAESIVVSNIPASITTNSYDVIVYFDLNLGVAARSYAYTINGVTQAGEEDAGFFSGTFKQATGNTVATATQGNYVRFSGLTASTFTLTGAASLGRAPISGIQIVGNTSPPPVIVSFTSSLMFFTPGDSVTLDWTITGATSASIDQGVGNVALTGSTVVTPTTTTTYTLTALNGTTPVTAEVTVILYKGEIHIYLLGGQSNMQGVGRKSKLAASLLDIPEVMLYHSDDVFSTGGANTWMTLRPAGFNSASFGPEIGFGDALRKLCPNKNIAFIKHAFGGSSLEIDWKPGANAADTANWGPKYTKFVSTVNGGINALIAEGYTPVIHGMCWQQGEQDAKDGVSAPESNTSADDYGANLSHLIDRVREQFSAYAAPGGIRFVLGQVLPYAPAGGDVVTRFTGRDLVRQAELNLDENSGNALAKSNTATVPTNSTDHPSHEQESDGYRDTDEVHLNATAQLALGRSMAYKMFNLTPQTFSEWATAQGVTGNAEDDDDNDGDTNSEEFYQGTDPTDASSFLDTDAKIEDVEGTNYLTITIIRDLNALDVSAIAEISEDLIDWNDGIAPVLVESSKVDNLQTIKYRAPWSITDMSHPKAFLRCKIAVE